MPCVAHEMTNHLATVILGERGRGLGIPFVPE